MRVLLAGVCLAAFVTPAAHAATIAVPPGDPAALIAAVKTANGTAAPDTLEVSGTYAFAAADNAWYGPNALPPITSEITIAGSPTAGAVIMNTAPTRLRLLYVADNRSGLTAGTLRLRNVELRNGIARGGSSGRGGGGAGLGGAIYNQGALDLNGVTFAGNQAIGGTVGLVDAGAAGGGGMGADGNADGGGFGGATPGVDAGSGGAGGAGGGGGGGYGPADDGANGTSPAGGGGGGTPNGLGGANRQGVRGGNGSGAGGPSSGAGGAGGAFGAGGAANAGGGGVGGGGGSGGGSGGFGGGGGWENGFGGFGGGGAGNSAPMTPSGKGGFGGGNGGVAPADGISLGGGGGGLGGAIFNDRGTITGVNSTFSENVAAGGNSTTMGISAPAAAGAGGDAYGAAIFNLNGTLTLTHVTVAGNTTIAGVGASIGAIGGTIATLGYDSAGAVTARTDLAESVISANPLFSDAPATVADGTANAATRSVTAGGSIGGDPEIATLGDYGGPTRTMAPFPGSPVIGAATDRMATDQRGLTRAAPLDLGAVETAETTIAANDQTVPFSAAARDVPLSALVTPGHGSSVPGRVTFTLTGGLGPATSSIAGNSATAGLAVPANTPPGTYTITATSDATPGYAAGTDTATLKILLPPQVCAAGTASTPRVAPITVAPSCTGSGPRTLAVTRAPAHGTVTIVGDEFRYAPAAGFTGTDAFTYTATNEGGPSNPATVTLTVGSPAPVCNAVAATAGAGKGRAIALDCASELDLAFTIVAAPAHGTLSTVEAGTVTYTSAEDYAGADTFTYRATNSTGPSNTATVTIDVKARPTLTAARSHAEIAGRFDPQPGSILEFRVYPNLACTGAPVFTQAVEPDATGVANVAFTPAGDHGWQVTYSGDANNLGATSACDPVRGPAALPAARVCGDPVTLLDILPAGKRLRVRGFAQRSFAGQTVTVRRAGKAVGTATVGADGMFAATVTGSAGDYTATLGSLLSRALRYGPQVRIAQSGTGRLELRRKPRTITVVRVDACANRSTRASVRVAKSGRFKLALGRPDAGSPYAVYRISAKVGGKTYSTQVAVTS